METQKVTNNEKSEKELVLKLIWLLNQSSLWSKLKDIDPKIFIFKKIVGSCENSKISDILFVRSLSRQLHENCLKTISFLRNYSEVHQIKKSQCLTIFELRNFCVQLMEKILIYEFSEKSVNFYSPDMIYSIIEMFNIESLDYSVKLRQLPSFEDTRAKVVEALQNIHNLKLEEAEIDEITIQLTSFTVKIMFDALRFVFQFRQKGLKFETRGSKFAGEKSNPNHKGKNPQNKENNKRKPKYARAAVEIGEASPGRFMSQLDRDYGFNQDDPNIPITDQTPEDIKKLIEWNGFDQLSRNRLARSEDSQSVVDIIINEKQSMLPYIFTQDMIIVLPNKTKYFLNDRLFQIKNRYNVLKRANEIDNLADEIFLDDTSNGWTINDPDPKDECFTLMARFVSKCLDYLLNPKDYIMYSEAWDNYVQCLVIEHPDMYYDEIRFVEMIRFMNSTFAESLGEEFDETERGNSRFFHCSLQFLRFVTTLAMDILKSKVIFKFDEESKEIKSIQYIRSAAGNKQNEAVLLRNNGFLWPENEENQLERREKKQGGAWKTSTPSEFIIIKSSKQKESEEKRRRRENVMNEFDREEMIPWKRRKENLEDDGPSVFSTIANGLKTGVTMAFDFLKKLGEPSEEFLEYEKGRKTHHSIPPQQDVVIVTNQKQTFPSKNDQIPKKIPDIVEQPVEIKKEVKIEEPDPAYEEQQ